MKMKINFEFDTEEDEFKISLMQTLLTLYKEKGEVIVSGDVAGFRDIVRAFLHRFDDVVESYADGGVGFYEITSLKDLLIKLLGQIEAMMKEYPVDD